MNIPETKQKGGTLVELVLVAAISVIITIGIMAVFVNTFEQSRYSNSALSDQMNLHKVLRPFAKEVREAQTADDESFMIDTATSTEFSFFSNIDEDPQIEKVSYYMEEGDFKKDVIDPVGVPPQYLEANKVNILGLDGLTDVGETFKYYNEEYDGSGAGLLVAPFLETDIKVIEINVGFGPSDNIRTESFISSTVVKLRNDE